MTIMIRTPAIETLHLHVHVYGGITMASEWTDELTAANVNI